MDSPARKMPVLYVAGAFRSKSVPYSYWEQTLNIRKAEEVALRVWQSGAVAMCPHLNTINFQGAAPDDVWLEGDLELLRRCDGVVMVPGWKASSGACAERNEAVINHIPVFYAEAWEEVTAFLDGYLDMLDDKVPF